MKELNTIQTELVANKDKHNQFGGFDYRSLESIMTAVKPLLKKTLTTLTFTDDIVFIEGRFYVKSTATLKNSAGETETAVAFAREQDDKKGMDNAQVTGACSSYSRKYAACSLLGISDGFDPDAMDNREEGQNKPTRRSSAASKNNGQPSLEDAVKAAQNARTAEELTEVWKTYRSLYGKEDALKLAIAQNPANPKNKK